MSAIDDLPPLREVVRAHGLMARKSLGQNFLFDLNLTSRIVRACADSLRRLQTDRIDLYQIHMQDIETPEQETLRALDDLMELAEAGIRELVALQRSIVGNLAS